MDYKIIELYNVKKYEMTGKSWTITYHSFNKIEESCSKYFILEKNESHNAFAHFFYECGPHVKVYLELKKTIPDLKLHLLEKKGFKLLILSYLGVKEEDIYYEMDSSNRCYLINKIIDTEHYKIDTEFHNNVLEQYQYNFLPNQSIEKTIPILILPRQRKENYVGNNRVYYTEQIENAILEIDPRNKVLHTDTITDLKEQIEIIQKAYIIIVSDGSPALVNSLFAINSHIIILGNILLVEQVPNMPFFAKIMELNSLHNLSITSIPDYPIHSNMFDIDMVKRHINDIMEMQINTRNL